MGHESERAAMIYQNMRPWALTRGSPMRSALTSWPSTRVTMTMVRPVRLLPSASRRRAGYGGEHCATGQRHCRSSAISGCP
jgi:hypothetical protein